jgi:anti-anti-sigma factor
MPSEPLVIEDIPGPKDGQRIFRLTGPLTMSNLFEFQSKVRQDTSRVLMLDFTDVPYADSAGIGALVGAYITHQKDGRSLYLIGVTERVRNALKVTHVEQFFNFVPSVDAAEQALNA